MTELGVITLCFTLTIFALSIYIIHRQHIMIESIKQEVQAEREQWKEERKDLYNRIQSSNYAEYNAGEVKKIKAEKDEPPKYNLL